MREMCRWCFGTGKVDAERFFKTDLLGNAITGQVECGQCHGRGYQDWVAQELHAFQLETNQKILRKAVDLGGSAQSRESKMFGVTEIREGKITHVYFKPKAVCELLGLIFPGDVEDMERTIASARYGIESDWVVKPLTEIDEEQLPADQIRRNGITCKALQLQLNQQYRFTEWDDLCKPFKRNDRFYSPILRLKDDVWNIRRGRDVKSQWRAAVEAVRASTSEAKAA